MRALTAILFTLGIAFFLFLFFKMPFAFFVLLMFNVFFFLNSKCGAGVFARSRAGADSVVFVLAGLAGVQRTVLVCGSAGYQLGVQAGGQLPGLLAILVHIVCILGNYHTRVLVHGLRVVA